MKNIGIKIVSLILACVVWFIVSAPRRGRVRERIVTASLSLVGAPSPKPPRKLSIPPPPGLGSTGVIETTTPLWGTPLSSSTVPDTLAPLVMLTTTPSRSSRPSFTVVSPRKP